MTKEEFQEFEEKWEANIPYLDCVKVYEDGKGVYSFSVGGDYGSITIRTNGPQGGDSGHGCFTQIRLVDIDDELFSNKWHPGDPNYGGVFEAGGDWELAQIIKSFEVLSIAIRKHFNHSGWLP